MKNAVVSNSVILLLILIIQLTKGKILDTSSQLLARQKRWLLYQEGVNWVQMVVGVGLPIEVNGHSVTWGVTLKSYYLLPTNATEFTDPLAYNDVSRKKRSTSLWDLYSGLEYASESAGFGNGRACLLRSICEISSSPLDTSSGLFAEILHLLLTPSSSGETVDSHTDHEYHAAEHLGKETNNCAALFPECSSSLVSQFTRYAKDLL